MAGKTKHEPSIGFFAPSGYLADIAIVNRAAAFFHDQGWRVSAADSVFTHDQRFAGPDDLRLADLHATTTASDLDVAMAARGGYGLTRLLGQIDYEAIAAAPRPIVGYSDFTAFNLAYLAQAGGISFQGPSASDFFLPRSRKDLSPEAKAAYRLNQSDFLAAISQPTVELRFEVPEADWPNADARFKGTLWGGNLAMICSLLGTPYLPKVRSGILFLEDVNEPAYRVERMLLQLHHAGVLAKQKLIVLGDFTGVVAQSNDNGYGLDDAIEAVRQATSLPIIRGLPFGHGSRRTTLAVGAAAQVTLQRDTATQGVMATLTYHGHPVLASGRK